MVPWLLVSAALGADWSAPTRWEVTSEVRLPAVMWLSADRNLDARLVDWGADLILDCAPGTQRRRGWEVRCAISDAALRGAPMPGDEGRLQQILDELDVALTGSALTLGFGPTGSLRAVDLDGPPTRAHQHGATRENLRLLVSRAVAGFDQPLPERDVEAGWSQRGGWILQVPASAGTSAGGRIRHGVTGTADDGSWRVASTARAVLEPHSAQEWPDPALRRAQIDGPLPTIVDDWVGPLGMVALFDVDLVAAGRVDAATGLLIEREWAAIGKPTPGSRVALASVGRAYVQRGRIARLAPDAAVALGENRELPPPDDAPTAIQSWEVVGEAW